MVAAVAACEQQQQQQQLWRAGGVAVAAATAHNSSQLWAGVARPFRCRAGQLLLLLQQLQQREQLGPCYAEQCLVLLGAGAEQQRQPGLPWAVLSLFSSSTL